MGGTSACCVEKDPQNESKLSQEASSTKGALTRKSMKFKYDQLNDTEEINGIDTINSSIAPDIAILDTNIVDTSQTKKRGSIIHIDPDNTEQTEDKKDDSCNIKQNNKSKSNEKYENTTQSSINDRADRASYDSENENSPNSLKVTTKKTRHHKSSYSRSGKKKHKKSKNKLVSALRQCINDFNTSMQSALFKATNTTTSTYDQNELLDSTQICKFFKSKKYDIQWFLLTKRNKFIKIMVNKWPNNVSILSSAQLYDMLQERISEHTPSVSQSSMKLTSSKYNKPTVCIYFCELFII